MTKNKIRLCKIYFFPDKINCIPVKNVVKRYSGSTHILLGFIRCAAEHVKRNSGSAHILPAFIRCATERVKRNRGSTHILLAFIRCAA